MSGDREFQLSTTFGSERYNLKADFGETHDICCDDSEIERTLRDELVSVIEALSQDAQPSLSAGDFEALRALGYIE